jgi:hypothetical protein
MIKTKIAFAQRVKEIKFMEKLVPTDVLWVPLNLETYIYLIDNKKKYLDLSEILNNKLHVEAINESEKLISLIKKKFLGENFLRVRYINIIRKYFNSIFFVTQIMEEIIKKYEIKNIYLSGWDTYDLKHIQKNFIVSRIIKELFSKKFKINILSKINYINNDHELEFKNFKKINFEFIYLNNLGYNFLKLVKANLFSKVKIVTIDERLSLYKKIIYMFLGVRFISISSKKNKNKKKSSAYKLPELNYKYKNYNLTNLLFHRNLQIKIELNNLLGLKSLFLNLFDHKKPKIIFLNFTRGINNFLINFSKKENIPCILVPHGTLSHQTKKNGKIYNKIIAEEITSNQCINCAQTKIAYGFFKKNFKKKNYFKSDNLIFSKQKRKKKKRTYILYAVTNRDFVNTQFFGIETFYEFFNNLKILNNLAERRNIKIIVKLHPGISYLINQLQIKFNFLIFSNKQLEKLLTNAKSTISFSSTAIEDSLCSEVPVVLFDKWKRYNHCEIKHKKNNKKSIIYIDSEKKIDQYFKEIDKINGKNFSVDLKKYVFKNFYKNNFKSILTKFINFND